MTRSRRPTPSAQPASDRCTVIALALLIAAAVLTYVSSLHAPFVFDDVASIVENTSIRRLGDLHRVLHPPSDNGVTVGGRPLLNLSFALNHAAGGYAVTGYHMANIAIHVLAGLALFGLVRRSIQGFIREHLLRTYASEIAFAVALGWLAHPLQTESVAYIVQRAESLVGLFYLLTVYTFIRGVESGRRGWYVASVASCLCGMATKEVMVTAPVLILLLDRTLVAGSLQEAWRRRAGVHLALFSTWALLAVLVLGAGSRGGTIGPGTGIAWCQYALCQAGAVWHYVSLSLWPHPLIIDYGSNIVSLAESWPYLLLDGGVVTAVAIGLWRRRTWAFVVACFFLILSPSSSVVGGVRQMLAEHRMYLPLAALALGAAAIGLCILGKRMRVPAALVVLALASLSIARQRDYASELALWRQTAVHRPNNPAAHGNLGLAWQHANQPKEALAEYQTAVRLNPNYADVHNNLGHLLFALGRVDEAIAELETTVRLRPVFPQAEANLGAALVARGRTEDGISHLQRALELNPEFVDAHNNLAIACVDSGRIDLGVRHARLALQLQPSSAEAHHTLGVAAVKQNRLEDAAAEFRRTLELDPSYERARRNLARVEAALGKP